MVGSVPRSMADQDLTPEARPDEELTNAFNALFVDAYHLLEGGTQKVFFMSSLSRERQDLTTYDREPDFHLQFKPWILQAIVANDNGDMWPNSHLSRIQPRNQATSTVQSANSIL